MIRQPTGAAVASGSGAQRDEGMASDELADVRRRCEGHPIRGWRWRAEPVGVATPERGGDRDGFVFAEETVFRYEAVTGDADFSGRTGARCAANRRRVPNPRRSRPRRCRGHRRGSSPPCRAADRSCDRRGRASGTSGPASSPGRGDTAQRHPEHRQREPSRRAAKAEQLPLSGGGASLHRCRPR